MEYPEPLIGGVFLRRWKRFFCEVRLDDGREVTAHLANTGKMTGCTAPEAPVRVLPSHDPKRKLKWSVEQIAVDGQWICVNSVRPNQVVAEAVAAGRVAELTGYDRLRREQRLGESRVDLRLEAPDRVAWVEVKNATLLRGDGLQFPDTVTARGARHVRELAGAVRPGVRAVLLFHVGHEGGQWVGPARDLDPDYATALDDAVAAGVEVLAYRAVMDETRIVLGESVPVRLG